jgi:tetratricopeptide (TPR) repeat protein
MGSTKLAEYSLQAHAQRTLWEARFFGPRGTPNSPALRARTAGPHRGAEKSSNSQSCASVVWQRGVTAALAIVFVMACNNAAFAEKQLRNAKDTAIDGKSVEALYNAGVAAANKKQWEKACDLFTQAFAREPNPQIAANLGNAELRAGRMRLAAEHLDYFLQEDKEADKQARLEIQTLRDQAAKHVVMVQVIVDHDGADVVVDGIVRGKSPLKGSVFLEPGMHKFEARKVGFTAQEQSFDLDKDARREIRIKMEVDPRALYASKMKGDTAREPAWRSSLTVAAGTFGLVGMGLGITFVWLAEADRRSFVNGGNCSRSGTECANPPFLKVGIASLALGTVAFGGMFVLIGTSKTGKTSVQIRPEVTLNKSRLVIDGVF